MASSLYRHCSIKYVVCYKTSDSNLGRYRPSGSFWKLQTGGEEEGTAIDIRIKLMKQMYKKGGGN